MTQEDEGLLNRSHEVSFDIQRNIRYHERRMGYFNRLNKTITFIVLALGSGTAVTSLLASVSHYFPMVFGVVTTVLAAFDLVIGTGNLSSTHKEFKSKYLSLSIDLLSLGDKVTHKALDQIEIKIKQLEADEPPVMPMVNILAENDVTQAIYPKKKATEHIKPVAWFKRKTANFIYWRVDYLLK